MKWAIPIAGILGTLSCGGPALAQAVSTTSFQAGDFMVRLRADGVIPENLTSSVSLQGSSALDGSKVHVSSYAIPEIDLSYFLSPHWSIEAIAGTSRHDAWATTPLGRVDVGSTWVIPPVVTFQYHFPKIYGFIPYIGVGIAAMFFYNTHHAEGGIVNSVHFNNSIGPAIEAGIDYNITGRWYANAVVKQSFAGTEVHINHGAIIARTALDPTIVGLGIGYRF